MLLGRMVLFYGDHQDLACKDPVQITVTDDIEILLYQGGKFPLLWTRESGKATQSLHVHRLDQRSRQNGGRGAGGYLRV